MSYKEKNLHNEGSQTLEQLPREAGGSVTLEIFKPRLDMGLSNVALKMALL